MKYNAPDTVYYRQVYKISRLQTFYFLFYVELVLFILPEEFAQARAIEELSKKNFENIRQGGDGTEQQVPKPPARRGRPPNKHKKPAVTPTSQDTAPDVAFSAPKPTNNGVNENNSRSLTCDVKKMATVPEKPAIIDNIRWISEQRTECDTELSSRCGFVFSTLLC